MTRDNPLEQYFEAHQGRQIHKWVHYWDIYHRHLQKYRGTPAVIVEFGIQYGGSSQMWREYFGPDAKIYGVDIDPRCKAWEEESFQVFIGDQGDPDFLRRIADEIGPVDVVIEDGGHFPLHQITTFEVFYPLIRRGGVFLIEDLHTSYWKDYGGKLGQPGTFMEYAKALTDKLNAWHSEEPDFAAGPVHPQHPVDALLRQHRRVREGEGRRAPPRGARHGRVDRHGRAVRVQRSVEGPLPAPAGEACQEGAGRRQAGRRTPADAAQLLGSLPDGVARRGARDV